MENYGIILIFILVVGIGYQLIKLYNSSPILFVLGAITFISIIIYIFKKKK